MSSKLSLFGLAFILTGGLWAQGERATLNGTILDSSGAAIPGATVTASNNATGVEHNTTSTAAGAYTLPYLPPGAYTIAVTSDGFNTAIAENVELRVAQTQTLNITLQVGQVTESVTVSSTPPLLDAGSAEIGRYVSEKEYDAWPIAVSDGQRQIQQFIFSSLPGATGGTFEGSINGGQNYSHEILVEGMSLGRMDLSGGNNNEFSPSAEAVGEFKLQAGAMGAQYNGGQTAVANFAIKSGTNELHGTAFYYGQNEALNANTFANNARGRAKSPFRQHNYGFQVGGPLWIPGVYKGTNRTFWSVNLEKTERSEFNISGLEVQLPTTDMKQGNFERILNPAFTEVTESGQVIGADALGRPIRQGAIYDPATTRRLPNGTIVRDPFAGNVIPQSRWSPVAASILGVGITDPEIDRMLRNTGQIATCCPFFDLLSWGVKVDHQLSDNHRASFYLNDSNRTRNNGAFWLPIPGLPTNTLQNQATPGKIARLSWDWTVSPRVQNRLAYGYNRFVNNNVSYFLDEDWASQVGVQNTAPTHFPVLRFEGLPEQGGGIGNDGRLGSPNSGGSVNGSFILMDDMTFIRGKHSFRFGFQYTRYYYNQRNQSGSGDFTFSPVQTHLPGFANQTGHSFASFLLGAVNNASRGVAALSSGHRHPYYALYIADDWKASPKLTVNYGLRWEIIRPFREVTDRMSGIDLNMANPAAGGLPGSLVFANRFQDTNWAQFGPRIGFAYRMNEKTVVRAGYGITNMPPIRNDWGFDFTSLGFNGNIVVNPGTGPTGFVDDPSLYLHDPFPSLEGTLPITTQEQALFQDHTLATPESNRLPYVQNWNFTIQRQITEKTVLEAAYVGNKGTRLWAGGFGNYNALPTEFLSLGDVLRDPVGDHPEFKPYADFPDEQRVAQALRLFPQYTSLQEAYPYSGVSSYHSFQLTWTRRLTEGLGFLTAYTWSKAMGVADSAIGGGAGEIQDVFNRDLEKAVSSFHIPHFFKLTWIYELPFNVDGPLGFITNGWQITAIHNYRTGTPVTVSQDNITFNPLFTGNIRPDVIGSDLKVDNPASERDFFGGTPYLNPAAFRESPTTPNGLPLRVGTAPRHLDILSPPRYSEDFGLSKQFAIWETVNVEIGAQLINAFNRSWFNAPVGNVSSPNFGLVFPTGGGRILQLEGRVNF